MNDKVVSARELARTVDRSHLPPFVQAQDEQALLEMDLLMEQQNTAPHMNFRHFLLVKLGEAKRASDKDFTTIRALQNILAIYS